VLGLGLGLDLDLGLGLDLELWVFFHASLVSVECRLCDLLSIPALDKLLPQLQLLLL